MLETELFEFLEGANDGAFSLCQQGEILSFNPAAERLFGSFSSEVPGKSCHQILHGRGALGTQVSHERCSILECTAGRTGIPNLNLRVRPCSGERLWGDMSTVVWQNPRNQHLLATQLARDITRQKRTEPATEKMLQMCRQFNKIAEETVPAAAPVSALSEQEPHILRPFSSGKNSAVDTQAITGGL